MANAATIGTGSAPLSSACLRRDERLAVTARDRGIRDGEGVGLDAAAVVARDDGLGDLARGIGDQLPAGGRELGEVVGERGDERAEGPGVDAAPGRPELGRREVLLLDVLLQLGADDLDAAADTRADGVEQLLAALRRRRDAARASCDSAVCSRYSRASTRKSSLARLDGARPG